VIARIQDIQGRPCGFICNLQLLQRSAHRWVNRWTSGATAFAFKVMVSVQVLTVVAFLIISLASDAASTAHLPFNPREYPKKVVSCPAINRAENTRVDIELRTSRLYSYQCSTRRKQS
jgi:hypothetical protein